MDEILNKENNFSFDINPGRVFSYFCMIIQTSLNAFFIVGYLISHFIISFLLNIFAILSLFGGHFWMNFYYDL